MRTWLVIGVTLALDGCGVLYERVDIAPRYLVEACLQEAYPATGEGWGPACTELNGWAHTHEWAAAGWGRLPVQPSDVAAQKAREKAKEKAVEKAKEKDQ